MSENEEDKSGEQEENKEENNSEADGQNQEVDYKAKATALEAELEKIKSKELNFSKFKKMTEEEKSKADEEKAGLQKQIDSMRNEIKNSVESHRNGVKKVFLSSLSSGDAEKEAAVLKEYEILNLPEGTDEEIRTRMLKAAKLAGYEMKGDLSSISFGSGKEAERKEVRFTDTERGKEFYNSMFPTNKLK